MKSVYTAHTKKRKKPMVMPPPAWAKQLDEDPDQGAEEDKNFHAHQPASSAAPALGKGRGGVLDPHGWYSVSGFSKLVQARG